MDVINELTDFQLNKLIFFRDARYSQNTKTSYWKMYLNYISNLEIEYNKDLFDLDQKHIEIMKENIKDKSNQTILQVNAFINKYMIWYAEFYNKHIKTFDLTFKKEKDNSWYISKEDFFKMCDVLLKKNVKMYNIIPLLLARYGIVGKQACYIRNLKWEDINFENKEVLIYGNNRTKVISKIPVDNRFIEMILEFIEYETQRYNCKKVKNNHIIKSQITENKIINYSTLNSKLLNCFKVVDRISFTTLFNCAIIDYISKIYSNSVPRSNAELIQSLSIYYTDEILDTLKVATIKNLYSGLTGDTLSLRTYGRSRMGTSKIIKKEDIEDELENVEVKKPKDMSKNEIVVEGKEAHILIKRISGYEKVKINKKFIKKIENYKWYLDIRGYVVARMWINEKLMIIHLVNFILDKDEYYHIKYLNSDKLDCRLRNLEVGDLY